MSSIKIEYSDGAWVAWFSGPIVPEDFDKTQDWLAERNAESGTAEWDIGYGADAPEWVKP